MEKINGQNVNANLLLISKPGTLDGLEQENMPVRNYYRLADSRLSDALDR